MPDLQEGESVEMQGSARQPYVLKNVAGVYSCSCPAWRNQSLPIDQRTCKHLRKMRGDEAEQDRIGASLSASRTSPLAKPKAPPLLLAQRWENDFDLTGWSCPIAGGPKRQSLSANDQRIDKKARQTISRELGHVREQIVSIYIGQ